MNILLLYLNCLITYLIYRVFCLKQSFKHNMNINCPHFSWSSWIVSEICRGRAEVFSSRRDTRLCEILPTAAPEVAMHCAHDTIITNNILFNY